MKYLMLLIALLTLDAEAQSLGRLPGTVYPADRGPRSVTTLTSIDSSRGGKPLEWYFDGRWVITNNFAFQTNDVVYLLPGASFDIQAQKTLSFNKAAFWAPRQRCFTGAGSTDGLASYPHRFPEWSGSANYAMPLGYLDPPYAFSNVYHSVNYTNLAGDTNLMVQLWYINEHMNDWSEQGFADTNFVHAQIGVYSNYAAGQFTNLANGLTNLQTQIGALGTNKIVAIAGNSAATLLPVAGTFYQITFGNEIVDTHTAFSGSTFTAPVAGNYLVVSSVYLTHIDLGATTGRAQMSVYKNGGLFAYLGRHNAYQGGTVSVVNGSLTVALNQGDTIRIYVNSDGIANMTADANLAWLGVYGL